jgi:hypothetical protein
MINPTGYTALDLVGFTDKGTYASNVNYVKNDIVHYGGNLWRCKIDDTTNVTPAEGNNWTVFVGEPTNLVERIIAPLEENPATVAYATGRQIIYDDWLWEVIDDIAVGDPLIDYAVDPTNANIKKAVPVETQLLGVKEKEGDLTDLHTTNKDNLVAAVNEVKDDLDDLSGDVGTLSSLSTTDKTSAVAAINEVDAHADNAQATANAAQQMIAPIQSNLTASKAYAVGEQFVYNGLLYKATAAIAQGGTITINGNCELADSVTEQLKTTSYTGGQGLSSAFNITIDTNVNETWWNKSGNVIDFRIKFTVNANYTGWSSPLLTFVGVNLGGSGNIVKNFFLNNDAAVLGRIQNTPNASITIGTSFNAGEIITIGGTFICE